MGKVENISRRMEWLKAMLTDEIATVQINSQSLKNARSFCAMALEGGFEPIAYNTLKNHLLSTPNDEFGVHVYPDNFEYFLELRRQVYDDLVQLNTEFISSSGEDLDWKRMYRNALWQSNLCSTAYLSLRRDIQAILNADAKDSKLDYHKLEKALKMSVSTYLKIVSQEPESPSPDLKLVPGGVG